MKDEIKNKLEVKYQKAFSLYNKKEQDFFRVFNSDNGDWTTAQREMVKAWKTVDGVIQEIIKNKKK